MINSIGKSWVKALDSVTTTATGDSVSSAHTLHSFQFTAGAGTVAFEASLDGEVWHQLGTSNTPGEIKTFEGAFSYVRAKVTVYTSGSITVTYRGAR